MTKPLTTKKEFLNNTSNNIELLHMEVCYRCNLDCRMCEWKHKVDRKNIMDFKVFNKLITEAKKNYNLQKVSLGAIGEPTLHPNFPDMIKVLLKNNIKIYSVTNLSLPYPKETLDLIAKTDKLTVSIDGATKKTYEHIRRGANFNNTVSNLKYITSQKNKPFTKINFVIQKDNYHEIGKMLDLSHELNIDQFSPGFMHADTKKVSKLLLNQDDMKKLRDYTMEYKDKYIEYNNSKSSLFKPEYWNNPRVFDPDFLQPKLDQKRARINLTPCMMLWKNTFIDPSGNFYPCCSFCPETNFTLGNITKKSLQDIWNGQTYKKTRHAFKKNKPSICNFCYQQSNNLKIYNQIMK